MKQTFIDGQILTAAQLNMLEAFAENASALQGVANVQVDFGADPTGAQDCTAAFNAALATGKPVQIPPGTFLINGTLNIPAAGCRVVGAGMGISVIQWGCTSDLFANIAVTPVATTGRIWFQDFSVWGNILTNPTSEFNGGAHVIALPFAIYTMPYVRFERIDLEQTPYFGFVVRRCNTVEFLGCRAKYISRDCFSAVVCFRTSVVACEARHVDDNVVAAHTQSLNNLVAGEYARHSVVIADNRFSDGPGISISNSKQVSITGNVMDRMRVYGIHVGTGGLISAGGDGIGTGMAVSIVGNTITNTINPGGYADTYLGDYIFVEGASSAGNLAAPPGANAASTGAVVDLYCNVFQAPTAGQAGGGNFGTIIADNVLMRTRPTGVNYSTYGEGKMFTLKGWIDPVITDAMLAGARGVFFGGSQESLLITGNVIKGTAGGVAFAVDGIMQLKNVLIAHNAITEFSVAGVLCYGASSPYVNNIIIEGNLFDADPLRINSARLTANSAAWQQTNYPCAIVTNGLPMVMNRCHLRNMANYADNGGLVSGEGNVFYGQPAALGYNAGNLGIGYVEAASRFARWVILDGNVTSATYDNVITPNVVVAYAQPTTGTWIQGHFVAMRGLSVSNGVATLGWLRLTTGSGNVTGTDWMPVTAQAVPGVYQSLTLGSSSGPTLTSGTGAPGATQPKGSIYLRTDGGVGSTLYVSQGGGTWNAVGGA